MFFFFYVFMKSTNRNILYLQKMSLYFPSLYKSDNLNTRHITYHWCDNKDLISRALLCIKKLINQKVIT